MSEQLKVITQSAFRSFRKCPRYYEQYYVQLYRPVVVADPLQFGTVWHDIREIWWNKRGDERLSAALQRLAEVRDHPDNELDEFVLSKLLVMLRGYHERWFGYVESLDILGVEQQFEIPLVNPRSERESRTYKIQGKLDAVVRENGQLWVVEEKTAADDLKPESPYWKRLEVDPQSSLYYYAVKQMFGEQPAGVLYFVNVKPQYRPLKKTENIKMKKDGSGPYAGQRLADETATEYAVRMAGFVSENPEKYFQMVRVPRLERDIKESQIDVWDTAQAIRKAELSGTWLRNPDACIHPFGSCCSFLPVCTHRASLDDQSMYRKAETSHEELNQTS